MFALRRFEPLQISLRAVSQRPMSVASPGSLLTIVPLRPLESALSSPLLFLEFCRKEWISKRALSRKCIMKTVIIDGAFGSNWASCWEAVRRCAVLSLPSSLVLSWLWLYCSFRECSLLTFSGAVNPPNALIKPPPTGKRSHKDSTYRTSADEMYELV